MPWAPELFSFPALEAIKERRRREELTSVPFFDGLITGEMDALIGSFAGEPEMHHPVRGRMKGDRALERYATEMKAWMADRNVTIEDVDAIVTPRGGVEEVVIRIASDEGRVELPLAVAGDRDDDGRLTELRIYYSGWPLTGRHAVRPPLLQPDPEVREGDIVGHYQRALAAGDADAVVAAFEPDGYVREPAGDSYTHRGTDELRALFQQFFSNGGGIPLQHCAVFDDGRACALEYNVVEWGGIELPPQAGVAVYVRGATGKLAAARIYDDADPPLTNC
jgi:hypothetical protein